MIRIYTRDPAALEQEVALEKRFGKDIPMPNFLYIGKFHDQNVYVIQDWKEGVHLFEMLHNYSSTRSSKVAQSVAKTLAIIHQQTFPTAGFFNKNLEIIPFEKKVRYTPLFPIFKIFYKMNMPQNGWVNPAQRRY